MWKRWTWPGGGRRRETRRDECGAYEAFDVRRQTPVDCGAEEAVSAGTFCLKSIEQGPRGFVWDGRWRTVTRRCAQVSDRGISWGCDFGYHENGVYWEHCYCAQDACNLSTRVSATAAAVVGGSVFLLLLLLPPPLQ
ncbi:hypothetical protein HDE_11543 [Halotydeus destructor]|nr:hypothetical protein HDE_11543 [Halotydeus destructor]